MIILYELLYSSRQSSTNFGDDILERIRKVRERLGLVDISDDIRAEEPSCQTSCQI